MKRQIGKPWKRGPLINGAPCVIQERLAVPVALLRIGVVTGIWAAHQ